MNIKYSFVRIKTSEPFGNGCNNKSQQHCLGDESVWNQIPAIAISWLYDFGKPVTFLSLSIFICRIRVIIIGVLAQW